MPGNEVIAVIQKVCLNGRHGPYVIATAEGLSGSITFSLESSVWKEDERPELGEFVVLSKLRKKRAGWKAMSGRRFCLDDEKT